MVPADASIKMFRGVYCVYWRSGGQPKRRSLGTTNFAEARQKAATLSQQAVEAHKPAVTFGECWHAYRATLGDRPAARTMAFEAKAVLPFFGDRLVVEVDEALCRKYIAERRAQSRKDGTILTELNRVSAALGHAVKHRTIDRKPLLAFPSAPPPREVFLTKAEAQKLLDTIKTPHLRLFVILALTTGARSEALLGLTWDRVDIQGRRINFAEAADRKLKGRAVVPINDRAVEALILGGADAKCPNVISYRGAPVRSVKRGLARAAAAAGLPGVGPHAFRHSAARWQAEAGVPMPVIAQFLGHASSRVTERVYARFSPAYLAGAAAALEF